MLIYLVFLCFAPCLIVSFIVRQYAMHAERVMTYSSKSVRLSVRLTNAGTGSKQIDIWSNLLTFC